jgi:hypothetical protein
MRKGLIFLGVFIFAILLSREALRGGSSYAAGGGSHRQAEISVSYTEYEWWLLRWSDNDMVCQVFADHEGLPEGKEVLEYCGNDHYTEWLKTGPCLGVTADNLSSCPGLYMHFIASKKKQRTVIIDLPEASVWVTMVGCVPKPLNNFCTSLPSLLLIAEEPLPNQYPAAIHGTIGGEPFSCSGPICNVPLRLTSPDGTIMDFWADSSYGDSTEQYHAKIRLLDNTSDPNRTQAGYFVDILTSQWRGNESISACSDCWQAFPVPGKAENWLTNPSQASDLQTADPLIYLAGRLIASGAVKASECPNNGLLTNGWANACGLQKSRELVVTWQNRYDEQIIQASNTTGIPSRLLKNLLAQESQFWPGAIFDRDIQEYGVGHLTELGSDTLLLMNNDFYNQFCPLVLDKSVCDEGYIYLPEESRRMLRGALAFSVRTDCPSCPGGLDLDHVDFNIKLVAEMLEASCEQTGLIMTDITGKSPGDAAPYEDLWRFTLTSYHAGPGCLLNALNSTHQAQEPLRWDYVSNHLEPACRSAINFVERVVNPGVYFNQIIPLDVTQESPAATEAPPAETPTSPLPTETPTPTQTLQAASETTSPETPTATQTITTMP